MYDYLKFPKFVKVPKRDRKFGKRARYVRVREVERMERGGRDIVGRCERMRGRRRGDRGRGLGGGVRRGRRAG